MMVLVHQAFIVQQVPQVVEAYINVSHIVRMAYNPGAQWTELLMVNGAQLNITELPNQILMQIPDPFAVQRYLESQPS